MTGTEFDTACSGLVVALPAGAQIGMQLTQQGTGTFGPYSSGYKPSVQPFPPALAPVFLPILPVCERYRCIHGERLQSDCIEHDYKPKALVIHYPLNIMYLALL
ncbi:MAG: hypothetical protein R3F53_24565 [Gammaproteobacteria bacterium]